MFALIAGGGGGGGNNAVALLCPGLVRPADPSVALCWPGCGVATSSCLQEAFPAHGVLCSLHDFSDSTVVGFVRVEAIAVWYSALLLVV